MNSQIQLMIQQAIEAFQGGNSDSASSILKRILQADPKNLPALHILGLIKISQSSYGEAIQYLTSAVRIDPNDASLHYNLAKALSDIGNDKDALIHHKRAVALSPNNPEAWLSFGKTASNLGYHEDALVCYGNALNLNPNYVDALINKGATFKELKRYEEAIVFAEYALSINPNLIEAWLNKGVALKMLQRYDEAITHYDRALSLKPDYAEAWYHKALINLFMKKYETGWEIYDWRLKTKDFQPTMIIDRLVPWDGSHCKHLLIFSEQGIGDNIFYASMINLVKNRVEKITISIDIRLLSILSRSFSEIKFIDKNAPLDIGLFDAQISFGSLPVVLKVNPNRDERRIPYLMDDDTLTKAIKTKPYFKKQLKCGVAWKSSNQKFGKNKSIHLSEFNDIFQINGYDFINMQYGDNQDEIKDLEENQGVKLITVDGIDLFKNIDGLLSIIQLCDLIITTSNVTAHLAGALGKKTHLLVPFSAGRIWYWHDEVISSWYPNTLLYSQDQDFRWNNAINSIASKLKKSF